MKYTWQPNEHHGLTVTGKSEPDDRYPDSPIYAVKAYIPLPNASDSDKTRMNLLFKDSRYWYDLRPKGVLVPEKVFSEIEKDITEIRKIFLSA